MGSLPTDDPLAVEAVTAIHTGDVATLRRLLSENPELMTVGLGGDVGQLGDGGMTRRLLHVATDWPGHFPNVTATIEALVNAGPTSTPGSPDHTTRRRCTGRRAATTWRPWTHCSTREPTSRPATPSSAAARPYPARQRSGNGSPPAGSSSGAPALRSAPAATLGVIDRVRGYLDAQIPPTAEEITEAFWSACHGGQRQVAEILLRRGADWVGWDELTSLDAARR